MPLDQALRDAALPELDGTLPLPGLSAPATILRDEWGIPHLRTASSRDAWMALGFVHAQDRLFQMELTRRRALGRAAEWLGPAAAESDILVRRLGMEAACRRDFAALGEAARRMLEAYAAGVNGWMSSGQPLPVEYALLDAAPEPWEPWHSIAVMRRLGLLMGSVWFKLWRAAALPVVGPEGAARLRYDDGGTDLLCIPPGAEARRLEADLAKLAPAIQALLDSMDKASAGDEVGGGSNNWAVGPQRSATGRPVLAGDPHRVFEIPNMYAQHHLACDSFDMIGLTVPGVPGFPHFAHNGQVAYCVTHAFMDIHDLFVERFDADATHTEAPGGPAPVTRRRDSIRIRGGETREFDIVETRHGPVIAGEPAQGAAIALRSVQFAETDLSFDCLPRMTMVRSVEELFEATRGWGLIDHNLVAGDTEGHIGHLVRARLPRRPRENGWLPVPGWIAGHDWQGWIAHDDMPRSLDPEGGIIVTANNRVVADDAYPDYLSTDCHPPYRARRIAGRLAERPLFAPGDAASIHADTLSANALLLRDRLAALPAPGDGAAAALRERLLAWDGRMEAGETAPTAYIALRRALTAILAERSGLGAAGASPLAQVPPGIAPQNQLWWTLPSLLRRDDSSLLGGWSWDQALGEALLRAAAAETDASWGEAHQPRFAHPLSALHPEAAALLDPPSRPVGGDGDTVLANGLLCASGPAASYGALARYVFDVGDWEACRWVVFHGVSGQPGSPHYADQNEAWSATRMVPMHYGWEGIEKAARHRQELAPGAKVGPEA
ncbi:penicillin acylase family protein [Teichococcus oryzae]|uniref:Penicillin acylase family protein n=1 Tax=Teichococcus oryzae TaxID=1608942 RepID=A0A5B2TEN9_9PROT|nr:penicillin acylase family protein [Pseudoroseomonas oryzae]KAA2212962.1 penicillin acylase family protein [Pseudoroseomonas oryzae]